MNFSASYVHICNPSFTGADVGSFRLTFLIFASACVLAHIWATYFVPETANVPLEEIDKLFKAQTGLEERILREEVGSPFYYYYQTFDFWGLLLLFRVDRAGYGSTSFASRIDRRRVNWRYLWETRS